MPKLKGGTHGPVAILHRACHSKLHGVFTESELARDYHSIDRLLGHPEIAKFVRWIQRRPIDFDDGTRSLRRTRRGRYLERTLARFPSQKISLRVGNSRIPEETTLRFQNIPY